MLEFAFRVTQQEDMTMARKHTDNIRVGKYINIFSKRALFVPCHVPGHRVPSGEEDFVCGFYL